MPKLCEFETCRIQASYGEYYGKPIRCAQHKENYSLVSSLCREEGCRKRPSYNLEGENCGLYCVSHKKQGMVDVKNKRCQEDGCRKIPSYNLEGENCGLYCVSHKKQGMVNVINKKCQEDGCTKRPSYNLEGENCGLYCVSHKKQGMVDVIHKKCKANFCMGTQANKKYKGYCANCFIHLFPNDPLSFQTRCKTKEIAVRNYINTYFEGFQHDKPLWTGNCDCTHRRRIDHRKMIGNTLLCIETDENQHKLYDQTDEEIRYDDLMMIHGGKLVFIRFNPDKYKIRGKITNPMLYTRLPLLKQEIEKQISIIERGENNELVNIIKLYYDE